MITITQFSCFQLKAAKEFLAKFKPVAAAVAEVVAPEVEPGATAAAPQAEAAQEGTASTDPDVSTAAVAPAAPKASTSERSARPGDKNAAAKPKIPPSPEALAQLAEHLKLDDKKIAHLVEALNLIGNRLERVRQVRVVQSEGAPAGCSVKVG